MIKFQAQLLKKETSQYRRVVSGPSLGRELMDETSMVVVIGRYDLGGPRLDHDLSATTFPV